ncbi:hypothetical protein TorRG33x02_327170 [Trema orientale]|uniref:Uncharacterized protein n=1 Tax=Trema orientale TaxID=63057 RepID=A0A2P5BBB6_TREOI|nr:hypothetical protein TorRG33x02_327170 [Trema orientale]
MDRIEDSSLGSSSLALRTGLGRERERRWHSAGRLRQRGCSYLSDLGQKVVIVSLCKARRES